MLSIDAIGKRFGEVTALDGCSFNVERGRMLGFLGPNGAGKTTTMRAIFGLIELDTGGVLWDGRPIGPSSACGSATCRRNVGSTRACGSASNWPTSAASTA